MNRNIRTAFEQIVKAPRFNITSLYSQVWKLIEREISISKSIPALHELGESLYKKLVHESGSFRTPLME